jgi:hypothetical protein
MSDTPLPSPSADDLQFETVEHAGAGGAAATGQNCLLCKQPIGSTYFALGDGMLCTACAEQLRAPAPGSGFGRLVKASLLGLGAGLVGALIWFVIRRVTHYEIGLVAILVGLMVGKAVYKGSAGVGGRGYQILAVLITYCCIAANYMPDILQSVLDAERQQNAGAVQPGAQPVGPANAPAQNPAANGAGQPERSATWSVLRWVIILAFVFVFSLATPFLAGAENLIGLLIIGFALWEAWKLNARRPLPISGPYQLGSDATPIPSV